MKLAVDIGSMDARAEIPTDELRRAIAARYRITRRDVEITLRELERDRRVERLDRKRIRIR